MNSHPNNVGKPLKYTVAKLDAVIDRYFKSVEPERWTVTGLALAVGSKQLLQDYENRDDYADIVRTAKLKVENQYELDIRDRERKNTSGPIFALKNMGWQDRRKVDVVLPVDEIKQKLEAAQKRLTDDNG